MGQRVIERRPIDLALQVVEVPLAIRRIAFVVPYRRRPASIMAAIHETRTLMFSGCETARTLVFCHRLWSSFLRYLHCRIPQRLIPRAADRRTTAESWPWKAEGRPETNWQE